MTDRELPQDRGKRAAWVAETAGDPVLTEARYDAWAEQYDADVDDMVSWRAPAEAAAAAERFLEKEACLLDAGAGTGLVGQALAARGFGNIAAADLSQKMLDVAQAKGVYRAFHKLDLTQPLEFPADCFDGLLSVGTSGYLTGAVFAEFARIVRPGGIVLTIIGDGRYRDGGFEKSVAELIAAGVVESLETSAEFPLFPGTEMPDRSRARILRVR